MNLKNIFKKKMQTKLEFIGKINSGRYSDHTPYDALYIGNICLCEELVEQYRSDKVVFITFYISDTELTKDQFKEKFVASISGALVAECSHVYGTEYTGYMWTEEGLKVDGHNLYKDLESYDGKYCYLQIFDKQTHRKEAIEEVLK